MQYLTLNDGVKIPQVGFGTFLLPADGTAYRAVREALDAGYRHIDTAAAYFNEKEVGLAVKESGLVREEVFITSKLWLQDYGYEAARKGIEASMRKLSVDYIDLYLLHQPYGDVEGAWRALEEAKAEGRIRSIGVSNMTPFLYGKFVPGFESAPSVNQVEFNPYFQQVPLRDLMKEDNVTLEGWAPLGQGSKALLNDPVISEIARAHGRTSGEVILRFETQEGAVILPKSTNPERMRTNLHIFDFSLTEEEISKMRQLDKGHGAYDPEAPGAAKRLLSAFDVHANDK